MLWGEWESFTVYSTFGDADASLSLAIAPRGNIGGQGYAVLELSRFLAEHLGLHPTLETLRIPVVISGAIALVFFFIIASRWFGKWPALIATALLAVNPVFSQYQHELIIAGPSLMAFLIALERLQATSARPRSWLRWLTLGAALALVLLLYGPGRVLVSAVLALWFIKNLVAALRGRYELGAVGLLLRTLSTAATTAALLLIGSLTNARFFGPSILFPRNSENFLVSGSSRSHLETLVENLRIEVESLVLGGGSFHSNFLEATMIQGRYPIIPLVIVPIYLAGFVLCAMGLWRAQARLQSPFAAVLALAGLTTIPMLTSTTQLLQPGSALGNYVVQSAQWTSTLVNYRLSYFLIPAYLGVALAAKRTLDAGGAVRVITGVVVVALTLGGAWSLVHGRAVFAERVNSMDPSLTGSEGTAQWLTGYSLKDRAIFWGSHFQQHGQYRAWATAAAETVPVELAPSTTWVVPTSISCFPEAPLRTLSLDNANRNYHAVLLATYLSDVLPDAKVGFVHVPPLGGGEESIGEKLGRYSALLEQKAPREYDYAEFDGAGATIRGLSGSTPNVIITTTPTEQALATEILQGQGQAFTVVTGPLPCWTETAIAAHS